MSQNNAKTSSKLLAKLKSDPVLIFSWVLAFVSAFFVLPDGEYLGYIDWDTLALLFSLMTVVAGFKELGLFRILGEWFLGHAKSVKTVELILVLMCFFTAMFVTNDVALITFVPFAIGILKMAGQDNKIVHVTVLQTVAANLGSMVTPIGNPQNIYIYLKSGLGFGEFLKIIGPFALLSLVLLVLAVMLEKSSSLNFYSEGEHLKCDGKFVLYCALFALCLVALTKAFPIIILAGVTLAAVIIFDRGVLKDVDYSLLLTFAGLFIFVGNVARIEAVRELIFTLLNGREMGMTLIISQVISNVPATLLISGFTEKWEAILIGANLGGLGTLIASMANLISYKAVASETPHFRHAYVRWFTIMSIAFLAFGLGLYWILYGF